MILYVTKPITTLTNHTNTVTFLLCTIIDKKHNQATSVLSLSRSSVV